MHQTLEAADQADLWLARSLAALYDTCGCSLSAEEREQFHAVGADLPRHAVPAGDEAFERLNAGRRAVVLAALALDARITEMLQTGSAADVRPDRARLLVETTAQLCGQLEQLAGRSLSDTPRLVQHAAHQLVPRAHALSEGDVDWYEEWDSPRFPPNLVGS